MKKNKIKNLIINIGGVIASIILMYRIKTGEVSVEKSNETLMWIILILVLFYAISRIIKDFKRDSDIESLNSMTKEELIKIKNLKKKNKNTELNKLYFYLIITFLITILCTLLVFVSNIYGFLFILFFILIMSPIAFVSILNNYNKKDIWYYDFDEFLYYRYKLEGCSNKKEELIRLKGKIEEQKRLLNQRKKSKQLENKLLQVEELEIRRINAKIEQIKNYNEYKKRLPDGSELTFGYEILKFGSRKNRLYNIKSTLSVNKEKLKSAEQRCKIIENHKHLKIMIDDSGVIETEFFHNYRDMNYELLIDLVCYSYEVCGQFFEV